MLSNKIALKSTLLIAFSAFVAGCTNDSTSDLIGDEQVENATYTENIKPIIDNNCTSCHGSTPSGGAPMPLTTFENVREAVLNRNLIGKISLPQGDPDMMPKGGTRLPQNKINLIVQWEEQGLQE
jgi:uncharacterized membrane protein